MRKLYDEVKSKRYGTPEKRDVRQIVFKTDKEAEEALAKLKAGADIEAMAAELKLNPKDVNLGLVEQRDFGDPKVGAAVFALRRSRGSPSPFIPPSAPSSRRSRASPRRSTTRLSSRREPELRAEIAAQSAMPEVRRLHDAIEDQRASGKTLAEAAKAVGLETHVYRRRRRCGNDRSGKPIADLPAGPDLVKAAFASDIGVDNDTVATRDGGYVWYEVNGIEPARQKTFEEVKDGRRRRHAQRRSAKGARRQGR